MDQKTVDDLRDYYELPSYVTDEQIRTGLKGSLGEAVVNFSRAKEGLGAAVHQSLLDWLKNAINSKKKNGGLR